MRSTASPTDHVDEQLVAVLVAPVHHGSQVMLSSGNPTSHAALLTADGKELQLLRSCSLRHLWSYATEGHYLLEAACFAFWEVTQR